MKDKVVVITGATSGIGRAIANTFGLRGAKIFITGRNPDALDQTIQELSAKQIIVRGMVADVAVEEDNKKTIEAVIENFGKIDVLICNAGVGMRALFEELDLSVFNQVMNTNFTSVVAITKFALPHILKSKGSIVGISSINGRRSTPARTAYSASKFAMEGFLESLRTEVMNRGVHVLSVCPGFTASNIRNKALNASGKSQGESPRNEEKMMTAESVAELTYRAIADRKRDLILTTQGKLAVFLNKWVPSIMDKLVYNIMSKEPDSPLKKS